MLRRLSTRLSSLFRRARHERELDTELSIHLNMLTEQHLTTLLFDVRPNDGITYLAVSIGLLLVAFAACLVPARRAASVDPMVALRVG